MRDTWSSRPPTSTSAPGRGSPGPRSPTRSTTALPPGPGRRSRASTTGTRQVKPYPAAPGAVAVALEVVARRSGLLDARYKAAAEAASKAKAMREQVARQVGHGAQARPCQPEGKGGAAPPLCWGAASGQFLSWEWTVETVEGLAPDAASVTAARNSRGPGRGPRRGFDERAVWGLCRDRARGRTRRRWTSPGRRTSAPARRGSSPASTRWRCCCCGAGGDVPAGAAAEWVDGVAGRRVRGGGRSGARRAGARPRGRGDGGRGRARSGWRAGSRICGDGCATRCAAGSAPGGCAPGTSGTRSRRGSSTRRRRARLRGCGRWAASRRGGPDGWPERLLSGLGLLHLLCEAYVRADGPVATTCARCSGSTWRGGGPGGAARSDRWMVLARVVIEQERLRVQRTWLWGVATGRPALLLDFAPLGAPLSPRPVPGSASRASWRSTRARRRCGRSLAGKETWSRRRGASARRGGGGAARRSPKRSRPTRGSTSGRSRWRTRSSTGATRVGGLDRTARSAGRVNRRALARCSPSPAGAVSFFGLWNGAALAPLAAGDGERTVSYDPEPPKGRIRRF